MPKRISLTVIKKDTCDKEDGWKTWNDCADATYW